MLRSAAIALLTTAAMSSAQAADLPDIAADLSHYISDFNLAALDEDGLDSVERILRSPNVSHGQKVLALHTVLERGGALEHADMHGTQNLLTAEMR